MRTVKLSYLISGLVSLGYQLVWLKHFVDRFGSSTLTFVLVIGGFIGGLGLGALASQWLTNFARRRLRIQDDLTLYGWIELAIVASTASLFLEPILSVHPRSEFPYALQNGIYEPNASLWLARLPIAALCVLVPCFLMGTTYPLLCRAFGKDSRFPAALYAWNTLGACTSVLACEFVFFLRLGIWNTFALLLGANLALGAFFVTRGRSLNTRNVRRSVGNADATLRPLPEATSRLQLPYGSVLLGAAVSGFLSGALEADAFRRIHFGQVYNGAAMAFVSFWAIAAIYAASLLVDRLPRLGLRHIKAIWLAAALSYTAIVYLLLMRLKPWLDEYARNAAAHAPAGSEATLQILGVVFLAVGAVVFVPYAGISTLLPFLCNTLQSRGRHVGLAYGLNTVSFLSGLIVFSWVAPVVNAFYAYRLWLLVFAVLVLLVWFLDRTARVLRTACAAAAAIIALGAATVPRGFDRSLFPKDFLLHSQPIRALKGSTGFTSFIATDPGGDYVHLDTTRMSGTSFPAKRYMKLMIHFPLLAQEAPRRALLICFGVGNSGSAIAKHRELERINVVDLSRNILETASEFSFHNDDVYLDPRVRMIHDDGRSFLDLTSDRYDLITSEPPPPLADGIHRLYSLDYYLDALDHLTPTGCMSQWLPAYQLPPQATQLIARTFARAFPHCLLLSGYKTEYLLIGSKSPIDLESVARRFGSEPSVAGDLSDILVPGPESLLATVVMADAAVRAEFPDGPVLTDDRNLLSVYWFTREAPSLPYRPDTVAAELSPAFLESFPQLKTALTNVRELYRLVPSFPPESLIGARAIAGIRGTELPWDEVKRLNLASDEASRTGRIDEALMVMERSLQIVPEQLDLMISAGWMLLSHGRAKDAEKWFERCLPAFDAFQLVHYSLATAKARLGNSEGARLAVQRALAINPRYFEAQLLAGQIAEYGGDRSEAAVHYQRCIELKPRSAELRAAQARVSR